MSLTGQNKTNSSTLAGVDKTSANMLGMKKSGAGWDYDQADITYNMVSDAEGREIFYDGIGQATTLVGLDKTSA